MTNKPTIIFRADGNVNTGLGHVIRSCALAAMLKEDFNCRFFIRQPSDYLKEEILKSCHDIQVMPDLPDYEEEPAALIPEIAGADIIVLDGYQFKTAYQQHIRNAGHQLVCIDDIHSYRFIADAVINHSGGLTRADYDCAPLTQLFLGPSFALLRQPFLKAAINKQEKKENAVFINLGGADIHNDVEAVLKHLVSIGFNWPCKIVLGSAFPHQEKLEAFIRETGLTVSLFRNLAAPELANLMQTCTWGICPPSTVAFEFLSTGGELYLKQTADNQKDVLTYFISSGLALHFDDFGNTRNDQKTESREKRNRIFDGKSDERLLAIFRKLSAASKLNVRRALLEDTELYFKWTNDPEVRKSALNPAPIPYDSHVNWFKKKVEADNAFLYVVSSQEDPIGQVRFDIDSAAGTALISYSIDERYRSKGLGTAMFRQTCQTFLNEVALPITLLATVRTENIASARVFESLGFTHDATGNANGFPCHFYKLIISELN